MTKRYEIYKDSGVQWLGEIPNHWEMKRLSAFFTEDVLCNKDFKYKRAFKFNYGNLVPKNEVGDPEEYRGVYEKYSIVQEGDILVNGLNLNYDFVSQRIACAPSDGIITSAYIVCRPRKGTNHHFFTWLLKSMDDHKLFHGMGSGIRLTLSFKELKRQMLPLPPLSEQRSIVTYLNDKCAKIDKSIETMEKQIALLQEMKQRVIADAVTRGVDKTVKMKKSGIAWLDEVPEHWDCVKLKAFCKENKTINKNGEETCVLSLSFGRIIIKQDINFGLIPDNYNSYQIVEPGYIILRLTDLQNDHRSLRTGLVKDRGIITSAYVGLIVCGMDSEYVHRLLHTYDVLKVFYGMGGGLRQSMNYQDVVNLYIPVPPIEEQRAIVSYINERTTKIETLAKKIEQEIVYLKEYKQRLISDVVTGQVKVC